MVGQVFEYTHILNSFCKNNLTHSTCSCLSEEIEFKNTFCQPGNPNCTTNDLFAAYIPVTCFGKNCSIEGYRFKRMIDQKCTITLCKQIINIIGTDIVNKTDSTLWCGNKNIKTDGTLPDPNSGQKTPADANKTDKSNANAMHESSISYWVFIIIGLCVLALLVALPLAIITYKRSKNTNADLMDHRVQSY